MNQEEKSCWYFGEKYILKKHYKKSREINDKMTIILQTDIGLKYALYYLLIWCLLAAILDRTEDDHSLNISTLCLLLTIITIINESYLKALSLLTKFCIK